MLAIEYWIVDSRYW